MLMLSAYVDETGHSRDERQKFVGMAGLLAPAANWEVFERKWKATLARKEFNIPYFHMKDFASFQGHFNGWNEAKRRKLFEKLLRNMEAIHPLPFGVIIPMDELRKFTKEQQDLFQDPYFNCFQSVIAACTTFLDHKKASLKEKVALVFSEQVEFKYRALKIYDDVENNRLYRKRSTPPVFRDMRELVPLQAADIIAYEMYKEFERQLHRPSAEPRFGYQRIVKMSERVGERLMFDYFTKTDIAYFIENEVRLNRRKAYWESKRKLKNAS